MHKIVVLWETSLTSSVTHYFRQDWLALLFCFLASTAWLLCTFWWQKKDRHATPLSSCPGALLTFCWSSCVEDRACYKIKLKTGWNKNNMKRLRGLTGMWLDWHWCGVGDFLTRTCLQGWHCSQRDNNVAFLHQRHQPALILSECLSSSGKKKRSMSVSLSCAAHANVISTYLQASHSNPFKEIES